MTIVPVELLLGMNLVEVVEVVEVAEVVEVVEVVELVEIDCEQSMKF